MEGFDGDTPNASKLRGMRPIKRSKVDEAVAFPQTLASLRIALVWIEKALDLPNGMHNWVLLL